MDTRKTVADSLHSSGYDAEEEYFFRKNQEAVAEIRARLDNQRRLLRHAQERTSHWMKCPKCGGELREHTSFGVTGDLCSACHGMFFDHGELELLARSRGNKVVLDTLRDLLAEAVRPLPTGIGQFPV